jgi:tetratricopeptide (TPR) repeat protein
MKSGKYRYSKKQALIIMIMMLFGLTLNSQGEIFNNEASEISYTTTSNEARNQFKVGLIYADAGDYLTSYSLFSKAIELDPYFALAYAYRALSAETKEEFIKDTRSALTQVHKVNAFEEVFIYINETYITGNIDQRLELAMRLTGLAPDNARAWMELGLVLQERNEIEEARQTFEKARLLSPDWIGIYTILGQSYLNYDPVDIKKGLEYYYRATELNPDIAKIHISLGDIYAAINETDKATQEYRKAITDNPESCISYLQNGYAKSCLGLFEESRTDYETARELSHANGRAYVMEALTYAYEGYPETCLQWLEEKTTDIDALDINDTRKRAMKYGCATASGWIALHFNKPDHFSQAKMLHNELNDILATNIDNPVFSHEVKVENLLWEGLEASVKGYFDAAIVKACDIKILYSENKDENILYKYHFLFGYVMYCQGRYGKAIEHLEQGDPNWVYNKYQLAKAYEANGETDIANVLFKEVAAYNINDIEFAIIRNEVRNYLAAK